MKAITYTPRILVVDNEDTVVESHGWSLLRGGCSVAWASDGKEAMDWLGTHSFDVVLIDIDMPSSRGALLVQAIRERFPCLPIVLVSGDVQPDMKVLADAWEAECVLETPVEAQELRWIIDQACFMDETDRPAKRCVTSTTCTALAS